MAKKLPLLLGKQTKGLVRKGLVAGYDLRTVNILTYSGDLSNAVWGKGDVTATATTVLETATDAIHFVYHDITGVPIGSTVTWSAEFKGIGRDWVNFYINYDSQNIGRYVNITTGEVGIPYNGAGLTATTTVLADGYVKVSMSATTSSSTTVSIKFWIARNSTATSYMGDITKGVYVRNAQVNFGPTALPYVATTDLQSVPNLVSGGAGLQRGSAAGADTNDPTPSLAGWVFDGVDNEVTSLPTKATTWTVINSSETSWEAVTSSGEKYVNGVADAGATEFDLTTPGGYTGILSAYYLYNRIITSRDIRQNYQYDKTRINSVGGSLP